MRVLVVEDEMLVAMELEALLREHGCEVVGPAPSVEHALRLLHDRCPDAALLDLNLNGQPATALAEALRERGVPVVLATGYSETQLHEPALRDIPRLSKPVRHRELLRTLARLLAAAPPD